MVKQELRVKSLKARVKSLKARVQIYKLRVQIHELRVQISPGTKFQNKLTILIFLDQIFPKRVLPA